MKILVVSTKIPFPIIDGHTLRTYNLLKQTARQHDVYLLSFYQTDLELTGIEHLRSICKDVKVLSVPSMNSKKRLFFTILRSIFSLIPFSVLKYKSSQMEQDIEQIVKENKIDLIHFDLLPLSQYAKINNKLPTLLVDHNIESALLARRIRREKWPGKIFFWLDWLKLKRFETHSLTTVDLTVTVSRADKDGLQQLSPGSRVTVVENGVDTSYFQTSEVAEDEHSLVYVGGLNWFPNQDAIDYFHDNILPLIKKYIPDIKLRVIGKRPAKNKSFADPAIELMGFVDDDRPYVSKAAVFIVPLRVGGGTRLKILNALSMKKAVVSTSIGCEGLNVRDGENILIADKAEEFAAAVIRLLHSPCERQRLGEAGRQLVRQEYEWNVIAAKMEKAYSQLLLQRRKVILP